MKKIQSVSGIATTGSGTLINSGSLNGLTKAEAIEAINKQLEADGLGKAIANKLGLQGAAIALFDINPTQLQKHN